MTVRGILVLLALASCSVTKRSTPLDVRYFSPEQQQHAQAGRVAQPREGTRLRLGRVTSSSYLRERIAQRRSAVELELSDIYRWTERPEDYVERSLQDTLFRRRAFDEAVTGPALELEVEVTAFEEVLAPRHVGRVQLRYRVANERTVLATDVITVEQPITAPGFPAVVDAIGRALDQATNRVADAVVAVVRAH